MDLDTGRVRGIAGHVDKNKLAVRAPEPEGARDGGSGGGGGGGIGTR